MPETDRKILKTLLASSPLFGCIRNRWQSDLSDLEILIGTWHFAVGDYTSERTFRENGSMSSTRGEACATWTLEDAVVRITYSERMWETLQRPLDPLRTLGDSHHTKKSIQAWKLSFIDTCKDILYATENDLWTESFDNCYQYGACPYLKLCQQHTTYENLNLENFHTEFWDVLESEE